MGIFLPITFRMHPTICRLVSQLSYGGRLQAHPSAAERSIELQDSKILPRMHADTDERSDRTSWVVSSNGSRSLRIAGVAFAPVEHRGNTQNSIEEAVVIAQLCQELLGTFVIDHDQRRAISKDDILVVAPYNLQVRTLESKLHEQIRVGTVDRFQGQEVYSRTARERPKLS